MVNLASSSEIISINESYKNRLLSVIIIIAFLSLFGNIWALLFTDLPATNFGKLIVPFFFLSFFPILVNYLYYLINRLNFYKFSENGKFEVFQKLFSSYYPVGLFFHSLCYTITIGLVLSHTFLIFNEVPSSVIFLVFGIVIWLFDLLLWINKWVLYPGGRFRIVYWLYWFLFFGAVIFVFFHTGMWKGLSGIMSISTFIAFAYCSLLIIIFKDVRYFKAGENKGTKVVG